MKATEFTLSNSSFTMSANELPPRSHYKWLMEIGRALPTSKAQAKFFVQKGCCLDVLSGKDVEMVESILNRHGFTGEYRYTRSKSMVRLINNTDLIKAIEYEFLTPQKK